jgi:SAM-dependent methyltransferase
MQPSSSPTYWDGIVDKFQHQAPIETWRAYMQACYERLVQDWLGVPPPGLCLKTDLFEEAISAHSPWTALGPGAVGIDVSLAVVRSAQTNLHGRGAAARLVVSDLRSLPFQPGSFGAILSGSSLDHFSESAEVERSLAELGRLLKPGGILVITFDNPHNPVVWIRNRLPFGWLNRSGLVPYYVGVTYTVDEARASLERLGLKVTHVTAVVHAPRAPAIWLLTAAGRLQWAWLATFVGRLLHFCEVFEKFPARYITGYYIALRAEKR